MMRQCEVQMWSGSNPGASFSACRKLCLSLAATARAVSLMQRHRTVRRRLQRPRSQHQGAHAMMWTRRSNGQRWKTGLAAA